MQGVKKQTNNIGGGGGGGTPGGSDTQIQFNDSGAFGGDAGLTYIKGTDTLNILGKLGVGFANSGSASIEVKSLTTGSIQGLRIEGDNIGNTQFSTFLTGDAFTRFSFLTDGRLKWSSGSGAPDTELYRSGANELRTPDKLVVDSGIQIGTSSTVGDVWTATDTSGNGSWQAGGSGATVTEIEVDFGTTPVTSKKFTITDVGISGTSKIIVNPSGNVATGRVGDDWEWDSIAFSAKAGTGNFTLTAKASGRIRGKRKIFYSFS